MSKIINLSARLATIVSMVSHGARVADIGADHALVSIVLLQKGIANFVIVADVNSGPLDAARKNVQKCEIGSEISIRLSDGFAEIAAGEVDTAIIAGMGCSQIIKILEGNASVVEQLDCLILQPQESAATVREWLDVNKWKIADERLVDENEIVYEIIKAVKRSGKSDLFTSFMTLSLPPEVGPILFYRRDPLLAKLITKNIENIERIIVEMNKAKIIDNKKIDELILKKIELSGVLDSTR
ncbi:MAG: class I SAM-dependent methyltransferase [Bacillota bacterium]